MDFDIFEKYLQHYLINFQVDHGNFSNMNYNIFEDFARAICDDVPFGYEASHRLASWIFSFLGNCRYLECENQILKQDLKGIKRLVDGFAETHNL